MDSALRAHLLRCLEYDLLLAPVTGRITNWVFARRLWLGQVMPPPSDLAQAFERRRLTGTPNF